MNTLVEILLGVLLIFLVVGQPHQFSIYTKTTFGKFLFLAATIGAGYYSLTAGILVALIYITLNKDFMLVESMENKGDFVKKYCKDGNVDPSKNPPTLKYSKGKCNPCDEDCEFEVTSSKERMTIDEALRPKESNTIPV